MTEIEQPQIYLISPREPELSQFSTRLAAVLDAHEVACVRLALSMSDESTISRIADVCREVTHERDVAIVIENHVLLAERLGLDGVHFSDGSRNVRLARKELGPDAIVGSYCAASRHDGMTAGEAGVDYVSFGPVGDTGLGDGTVAPHELFEWWSQMIEVPVVAEGALDVERVRLLSPVTDFFGIGDEIWRHDDPVAALSELKSAMAG